MNIKKTIITATVALTMVAMIAPMAASASPQSDALQAQINALNAQLNALNGPTGSMPAACVGVSFSRYLRVGMTGSDVRCLQVILNMSASTRVSATGAGSPGLETTYFGQRTLAAVMIWQQQQGWVPASQLGPKSITKLNAWLASLSTTVILPPTPAGLPAGCTSAAGFSPITGQSCATGNVTQTGPISAMLSSDTPTAGSIVGGQATADLLHVTFSGSGTVTSVTLTRSGISDQNTLSNVYLYDGNTRLTDGYSFNINSTIVMNGLNIAVNGSKVVSVRADVAAAAPTTASTLAVALTGYTANGSTSTANIMGNLMAVVVGNLATANLSANTVTGTPTVNAGTSSYTFWSAPLQVNVRAVWLKGAMFRMIGSAPSDALGNIRMFIDGVDTNKVATVIATNGSNYAWFDLNLAPISLMTGSHTIDVRANVEKGSNRTVQLSIQQAADLTILDPQVGVNIAIGGTVPNNAASITINTGSATVTVDPVFQTMTNISGGTTNAVIAKFKVHAYGEDVKVNSLVLTPTLTTVGTVTATGTTTVSGGVVTGVTFTDTALGGIGYTAAPTVTITQGACTTLPTATANIASGKVTSITITATGTGSCTAGAAVTFSAPTFAVVGGLNNVTLYFNGGQVGTQQTWPVAQGSLTYQLGSQVIAPAGQDSWLEVRADLQTTTNVSYTAGTVGANLVLGSSNAQGQTSLATLNFPTALTVGTTLSIQTGLLVVSKNPGYGSQSANINTAGVKIGSYILQNQSSSEAVRVTSLVVGLTTDGTTLLTANTTPALSNFSALRTSETSGSGSTPVQPTASNTFSVNRTLAVGESMTLDIFADTSSGTGNVVTTLTVSSIGAVSNVSSAGTLQTGQTITLSSGTLATPTLVTASSTSAQYIAAGNGGSVSGAKATYNFVSTGGTSTISELKFTVSGANTVNNVCVGAMCASPVANVAYITGLSLAVPNGGSGLTQDVFVSYSNVGTNGPTSPNTSSSIALTYVKYTSGGATTTITPSVAAPTMIMVGSKPAPAVSGASNGGLILTAENKVGEVTITADAKGNIKLNDIKFNIGSSGITTFALTAPRIADGTTTITGSGCGANATATTIVFCEFGTSGNNVASGTTVTSAESNQDFDGYQVGAGTSKTFSLFAVVGGTPTANINTQTVSSQVDATGFNWDDTSAAVFLGDGTPTTGSSSTVNLGTNGTNLNGASIYNFPTQSYSIHN